MANWRNLSLAVVATGLLTLGSIVPVSSQTGSPGGGEVVTEFVQLGSDIDGESAFDFSGGAVAFSADGQRVAIGASGNSGNGISSGHTRVFDFVGGSWVQVGADIDGDSGRDFSGHSVSLSADGQRLVIGARSDNGDSGGENVGHARVFDFVGGSWEQVGTDINGEANFDGFGESLSLSADGQRVAIGTSQNDGNGIAAGHVRVFEFVGGDWVQLGIDIDGEFSRDLFGTSVSLSANGQRVAVGAILSNATSQLGTNEGQVRVFEFVGGSWVQVGADLHGFIPFDEFGESVSLSADGQRVAVGAPGADISGETAGQVEVFELVGGQWVQVGSEINGANSGELLGTSVSLSADGQRLVVGAPGTFDTNSAGITRVFEFDGGDWVQLSVDIAGEDLGDSSGESVTVSPNGSRVAIGSVTNDDNGEAAGHVRVFDIVQTFIPPVVEEPPVVVPPVVEEPPVVVPPVVDDGAVSGQSFTVRAFGHTGHEIFEVRVDGVVVGEFAVTTEFAEYEVGLPAGTSIRDVEVAFTNDARGPGFDRNLVVDWVQLDGVLFETWAATTSSTGTFNGPARCASGPMTTSETLHCNGAFTYGGQPFTIRAFGHTGDELLEVRVGGVVVGEFAVTTEFAEYEVGLPVDTWINDVEVAFTNDEVGHGFDRNLVVDWVEFDGVLFETRAASTSSTGTFNPATRCTPGSETTSETLHCNGAFTYN